MQSIGRINEPGFPYQHTALPQQHREGGRALAHSLQGTFVLIGKSCATSHRNRCEKTFRFLLASQDLCRWLGTDHCYQTEALKGESATDFVLGKYSHIRKQIRICSPPKLLPVLSATSKGIFFFVEVSVSNFLTSLTTYLKKQENIIT